MSDHYILGDNHEVIKTDLIMWARWFENNRDLRRVAKDVVDGYRVSTVFLGLDHRFGDAGPPLLFETMVFPHESCSEVYCDRYSTWDEAIAGHAAASEKVQRGEFTEKAASEQ